MTRPLVGVSACLTGQDVRYDNVNVRHDRMLRVLGPHVEWLPVCPEVEIGMSVPREPIDLIGPVARPELIGRETGTNYAPAMRDFVARRVAGYAERGISGFVLTRNSPSCGIAGVRRREAPGAPEQRDGSGFLAAELLRQIPGLPVIEEDDLVSDGAALAFLDSVRDYFRRGGTTPGA